MRQLLISLLLASCLLPIAAGGMRISSSLAQASAPHSFDDLNSQPLWSSQVRRVDPKQQAYERLPAAVSDNSVVAEARPAQRVNLLLGGSSRASDASSFEGAAKNADVTEAEVAKAHEWCSARYRSYDPSNNSYQPYGGGTRRICAAPVDTIASPSHQAADVGVVYEPDANARWCMERYSSYRREDNSYQPFTGGRKQCLGPASRSASNITLAAAGAAVVRF